MKEAFLLLLTEGSAFVETDHPIDLISLSPKFSNSIPKIGAVTPGGKVVDQRFVVSQSRSFVPSQTGLK